jgi:hypothetical protein
MCYTKRKIVEENTENSLDFEVDIVDDEIQSCPVLCQTARSVCWDLILLCGVLNRV